MIFAKLTITNFGVYRGRNEFDLRPHKDQDAAYPIVLFGGKNGSGKTTILDAIRLCLYGRISLGMRVRLADYETYITQRLHRSRGSKESRSASIGLTFEHTHIGMQSVYDATRTWQLDGDSIREDISIYKDGLALQDIAPEHWDDFLRDLIPPGVADLFFFDGEKIQSLANDDTESDALATAVGGLLNLDLISRLKSDLSNYLRQQDIQNQSLLQKSARGFEDTYEETENRYQKRKQNRAQLISRLDNVRKQIEDARQKLLSEGAGFVEQRSKMEQRLEQVGQDLDRTRSAIRDLAAGLMPFAIVPKWCEQLQERFEIEAETEQRHLVSEAQHKQLLETAETLLNPDFQEEVAPEIAPETWERIAHEVQILLYRPSNDLLERKPIHLIAGQQREKLHHWMDMAINKMPSEIHKLSQQLERLETERSSLTNSLKQVPDEAIANPLLEKFYEESEKKGRLQEQVDKVDDEINHIRIERAEIDRQRLRAWQKVTEANNVDIRIERAAKVQVLLSQYLEQITAAKTKELEQTVARYFNLLSRKRMLVKEVHIDPERFTVTLYGENRTPLPKSDLSAGEKQLYAVALLWALRSVSGRALPIIMDTPLGRLDSDHREAMLINFFPHAAHQTIVLSTDTEIAPELYELLKPSISHTYRLDFDEEQGYTKVETGYFAGESSQ
jgi:DNA sulfur modification protein DndD